MKRGLFVLSMVGLLLTGVVWAQQNSSIHELEATGRGVVAPVEDPQLKMWLFDNLDAAGEGVITKEEFARGAEITIDTRQFEALDANNDGVLDRQEFMDVQIMLPNVKSGDSTGGQQRETNIVRPGNVPTPSPQ
jgi:hypothetical protein